MRELQKHDQGKKLSLRVLHLIPTFGPGGAERQLAAIAPAMVNAGVECHIGYCDAGPNLAPLIDSDVFLHELKIKGHHDPRLLWALWRLIRKTKPDVVQTWLLQMDVLGGLAALCLKAPLVLSERSSELAYPSSWKNFVRSRIGFLASAIVANSKGGTDYWRNLGAKTPLHLIPNCVQPAKASVIAMPEFPPESRLIVFAGRLSWEKNVDLLGRALVRVVSSVPDTIALIFGVCPLAGELAEIIMKADMTERIRLMGYTDNLQTWMQIAEICISTSKFEGHPNVILEAAAAGCPLLISDIPAHREILDDSSASYFDTGSVDAVLAGILDALENPQTIRQKALKAKQEVSKFRLETVVDRYLNLYTELAERR
jgi:glycosyltransferase involved in cell wall biosynthesis